MLIFYDISVSNFFKKNTFLRKRRGAKHFLKKQNKQADTFTLLTQVTFLSASFCLHACSVGSVMSDSLLPHGLQPTRLLCPWDSPGKNTAVGYHAFFQGIFLTQESNPCLLYLLRWQVDSLPLSHQGSPSQ